MNTKRMAVGEGAGWERDYDTLRSHLDQFAEDTRYLESIRPELRNKYPDRWVAVYKKQIVATAPKLKEIIKELASAGIPAQRTVIDYLRKEPIALIL